MHGKEGYMDKYHEWLLEFVRADLPEHRRYKRVLKFLDEKPFSYILLMDKNREADGYELRCEFMEETGLGVTGPVSCMEVLCALSRRIEMEIMGEPGNDHFEKWFWVMFKNLELDEYTDDTFDRYKVNEILDKWLQRRFKTNGKGSIFLTSKTDIDQREVDMWYQMQRYLNENYPI